MAPKALHPYSRGTAPRSIFIVLGIVWALAIWFASFALKQLAPPDALWAPAEVSIALLVAAWFIFGAKAAEKAHGWLEVVLNRPSRWAVALGLGLCVCAAGGWTLWHFAPERVLSRALLTTAMRDDPMPFYDPCLSLVKEPGPELSGRQLAGTYDSSACAPNGPVDVLAHASLDPVLIVGDPASGKRYLLKWLLARLAGGGQSTALLTMRDCRGLDGAAGVLPPCLDGALHRIAALQLNGERATGAAQAFLRSRNWWLLIDGLDDLGDERLVVPVIRELKRLMGDRGMHVIASARSQNLANILFRSRIDDEVRDALRPFRVYALQGLSPVGSREMLTAMSHAGEPSAAALNELFSCGPSAAAFARFVTRSPGSLTQLADFARPPKDACDSGTAASMREWLVAAHFEAYCRSQLCGSDVQTQELRELISCFRAAARGVTSTISREWIAGTLLDKRCAVKADRYHNVESVLRALLEIGLVHVVGLDDFSIVKAWSGEND